MDNILEQWFAALKLVTLVNHLAADQRHQSFGVFDLFGVTASGFCESTTRSASCPGARVPSRSPRMSHTRHTSCAWRAPRPENFSGLPSKLRIKLPDEEEDIGCVNAPGSSRRALLESPRQVHGRGTMLTPHLFPHRCLFAMHVTKRLGGDSISRGDIFLHGWVFASLGLVETKSGVVMKPQ